MNKKVLLIDDDSSLRRVTEFNLFESGYKVITAENGEKGLRLFHLHRPQVVITDVRMPGISGYDVLKKILELEPQTVIIIVTSFSSIEDAVEAMRIGAYDYLTKPFSRDHLNLIVAKAFKYASLHQENSSLKEALSERTDPPQIIGQSQAIKKLLERVQRIAASQASVLITGESGTGKEVIAKTIHKISGRSHKPHITVNCAAIPKDLLESELFGHMKGAFTGATKDRKGKFSLADGGTLFLDEIGELPIDLQPKLLRTLQEQEIEPVGGSTEKIDVRLIAATNINLEEAMEAGQFREDLYYRLAVVPVALPPLRERKEDIPLLIDFFLKQHNLDGKVRFSEDVLAHFHEYHWPGNVRELENVVEQMLILRQKEVIGIDDLPKRIGRSLFRSTAILNLPDEGYSLEMLEKEAVEIALRRNNGNKAKAAKFLKIPRHTLTYRIEKYNIEDSKKLEE